MNGRGGLPLTGWLALILALVGFLAWKQAPLDPKRGTGTETATPLPQRLQDINARLWEDPFAAVARARRDAPGAAAKEAPLGRLCEHLQARLRPDRPGADARMARLLILGVMASNAPYADGEERRRRTRYAVESALSLGHYVPENPDALGFFQWDGSAVPFELFRRKNASAIGASQYVVLLWLEDEALSLLDASDMTVQSTDGHPVRSLQRLRDAVYAQCAAGSDFAREGRFEFKVIGPAGSQTLRTMAQEVKRMQPAEGACEDCPPPIELYSPFATAAAKEMLSSRAPPEVERACRRAADEWYCKLGQVFWRNARVRFYRTISSDEALAEALVTELERREVPVRAAAEGATSPHHVALVSEWDTYYGRRLPAVFLRAAGLDAACETDPSERDAATPGSRECRVHRFSYLRGLDGEGPRASRQESGGGDKNAGGDKLLRTGSTDPAEGVRQFDYVRRLVDQITAQDRRLRDRREGEIGAIGVLGSDLYDKIAVVRALRPAFPRAVFFTTDLDARLLAAEHLDWTRNLVVASGFGLQLAPCLQKDVPPLRGTYQTAAFFAARVALFNTFARDDPHRADRCPDRADDAIPGSAPLLAIDAAHLDQWLARPRLFELGRTRPVDLSPAAGACAGIAHCDDIHPAGQRPGDNLRALRDGLLVCALILLPLLLSWHVREVLARPLELLWAGRAPGMRLRTLLVAVPVAAFFGWLGLRIAAGLRDPGGEPFLWLEGVSVWPSEFVRTIALALAVCALCHVLTEVGRGRVAVAGDFALTDAPDDRGLLDRLWGRFRLAGLAPGEVAMARLWSQFGASAHWSLVLLRSGAWTVLFLAGAWILFQLTGEPNRPARGPDAFAVDRMLILTLVVLFLLVLFCVNDVIRLCGRLFETLAQPRDRSDWPTAAGEDAARRLGVVIDDADSRDVRAQVLDPWLDVQFVASLSERVGGLTLLPFVLLALLVVARWPLTDRWDVPPALGAVFGASFVIAAVNAWLMQRAAARVRRATLARLEVLFLASKGEASAGYRATAHLEALIKAVQSLRRGAFLPFVEQPIVRAVLLPFSSAGGLYLIDLFALAN